MSRYLNKQVCNACVYSMCIYIYIYAHIEDYVCICIYIYTHVCVCVCLYCLQINMEVKRGGLLDYLISLQKGPTTSFHMIFGGGICPYGSGPKILVGQALLLRMQGSGKSRLKAAKGVLVVDIGVCTQYLAICEATCEVPNTGPHITSI